MKNSSNALAALILLLMCGVSRPSRASEVNDISDLVDVSSADDVISIFTLKTALALSVSKDPITSYRLSRDRIPVAEDGSGADRIAFLSMVGPSITFASMASGRVLFDLYWPMFIQAVKGKVGTEGLPLGVGLGVNWRLGKRAGRFGLTGGIYVTDRERLTAEGETALRNFQPLDPADPLTRKVSTVFWFFGASVSP